MEVALRYTLLTSFKLLDIVPLAVMPIYISLGKVRTLSEAADESLSKMLDG